MFGRKTILKKLEIVASALNKMSVMIDFTTINYALLCQKKAKKWLILFGFFLVNAGQAFRNGAFFWQGFLALW